LKSRGIPVSLECVKRLMKVNGILQYTSGATRRPPTASMLFAGGAEPAGSAIRDERAGPGLDCGPHIHPDAKGGCIWRL
jgi:hypothetical protein